MVDTYEPSRGSQITKVMLRIMLRGVYSKLMPYTATWKYATQ